MKGGLAAMLGAVRVLARDGGLDRGHLVFAAVADEEYASIGAEALVRRWRADAAVVAEPTDLEIAVAHKGFTWIEIESTGRAAHGSRPREGRDAILGMGGVLSRLEALDRELQSRAAHPLLGTPSLHASIVHGGRELSTYPDRCTLQLERRTLPGEPANVALSEVETILAACRRENSDVGLSTRALFDRSPYETPPQHDLPRRLESALAGVGHPARRAGMTYWTDAAILGHSGIPSVVFGPGGEGLHGIEEHVRLDEVLACRDALVRLARDFCGGAPLETGTRPSGDRA
jgi:acetylornithine deacetylase